MNRATPRSAPLPRMPWPLALALLLAASCTSEGSPPSGQLPPARVLSIAADPPAPPPRVPEGAPEAARPAAPPDAAAPKAPGPSCGGPNLPDCPLQGWMKHPLSDLLAAGDFEAVASALEALAGYAPPGPGYPYWRSISFDGASAARMFEVEPVHAACRGCHAQYLAKYKAELRSLPLPAPPTSSPPPAPSR